jgi:hypothetical protein
MLTRMKRASALLIAAAACSTPALALHAPNITANEAREQAAKVDLEPMVAAPRAVVSFPAPLERGDVAALISSGIASELRGRALRGGETGGYTVKCALDRVALRRDAGMGEAAALATLYVDAACEVTRAIDHRMAWRGELRGRCAAGGNLLQVLADRLISDVTREMASDLVVRALGLVTSPSARVFPDEEARANVSGLDDHALGALALTEAPEGVDKALAATHASDASTRAAAWNAVAMACGPGDAWRGGEKMSLDGDPLVRFEQYKALARLATKKSLAELSAAAATEDHPLLAQFTRDAVETSGIGTRRRAP